MFLGVLVYMDRMFSLKIRTTARFWCFNPNTQTTENQNAGKNIWEFLSFALPTVQSPFPPHRAPLLPRPPPLGALDPLELQLQELPQYFVLRVI